MSLPPTISPTSSRPNTSLAQQLSLSTSPAMIFPPAFLDSSSCWNINHDQLQLQQIGSNTHITTAPSPAGPGDGGGNNNNLEGLMAAARAGGGGGDGGGGSGGAGDGDGDGGRNSKQMSMSERAQLAWVPQPESGLNCPRCDSTNTKFCYFNNYSLTQPRHFCRACRRYWTRGGALHNVPVGGRYRRHAKRSAKPKAASTASGAGAGTSSVTSMTPNTTSTTTSSPALQYSMFGSAPPQGWLINSFDPASLGLCFPARLLFAEGDDYAVEGDVHHHQQGNENDMEQWVALMQSFPFLHAMDHQMAGQLAVAMPSTMASTQGMFHLGLQSGGMDQWAAAQMQSFPFLQAMDHQMVGPPAAAMPTTMAAMQDMFRLVLQSGGNGDDGGDHQFHHPLAKRDDQQQQQDYTSSRGIYGDVVNGNGGGGYNFYSSTSNAPGN